MKYLSDEYFQNLMGIAYEYALRNYDYYYLAAMHENNRKIGATTIITGSSHAMNGIVESALEGEVINFSISSQDLYFDFEHIKKAVEEGRQKIEICVIDLGYYQMYHDLSCSKGWGRVITKVFYPLLGKSHHYQGEEELDRMQDINFDKDMFAEKWVREFVDHWAKGVFMEESTYYGSLKTRENNNFLRLNNVIWNTLPEDEKRDIAIKRTDEHNKLKVYEHTRQENGIIVGEMAEYLVRHDILPVFVIFPFTKYYNAYIDQEYKADIKNILEDLPYPVEFLDMNDYQEMFDDSDFLDSDHLNLQGALKATGFLNDFLENIRESVRCKTGMDLRELCINLLNELMDGVDRGDFSGEKIPDKYTYGHLYAIFGLLDELDGGRELYEQIYDLAMERGESEIRRKCARGEKIKIAFLVISAAEWGMEKIYRMLEQDDRTECYIVVSPLVDRDLESRRDTYIQTVNFFEKNGYEVRGGCNEEFNVPVSWQEMGGMPDIVMHSTPWIQSMSPVFQVINFPLMVLNYYIPYGIHVEDSLTGNYLEQCVYNKEFINMMKRIYTDSERNLHGYQKHGLLHGKNVVYSGYAKMDFFYETRDWSEEQIRKLWKIPDAAKCQDIKKVIIAPHYSISGENVPLKFSTFAKNAYFFLYLAKKYCNQISFVFKPHPNLRFRAVKEKLFDSYEAYDAYLEEWNSLPNAKVVQESDYLNLFDTSDGMILDSISFLAEYKYVHKPLLYLRRKEQAFNPLGKCLLEVDYTAKGEDYTEIEKFLQEVIINGNDILRDKRQQVFENELDYIKRGRGNASEYIYRDIVSLF